MNVSNENTTTISREQLEAYWDLIPFFKHLDEHERINAVQSEVVRLEALRTSLSNEQLESTYEVY